MSVAGISRFSAYVPAFRLALSEPGGPERAVAGFDEDAITMAVAAGGDCLTGSERAEIDALIFASTSSPFREKQAASIIAKALDLGPGIETIDVGGTLRSGTGALMLAADKVMASTIHARQVASDPTTVPTTACPASNAGRSVRKP